MGILVLLLLCLAAVIIKDIYDSTDHSSCDANQSLRIDAVPIDVQHKIVGTKGHRRVRTTVLFDDGFQYISHKTDVEDHTFSYSISLSSSTNAEIIYAAKEAHEKQYLKWREKCGDAKAKDTHLRQGALAESEVSPSSNPAVEQMSSPQEAQMESDPARAEATSPADDDSPEAEERQDAEPPSNLIVLDLVPPKEESEAESGIGNCKRAKWFIPLCILSCVLVVAACALGCIAIQQSKEINELKTAVSSLQDTNSTLELQRSSAAHWVNQLTSERAKLRNENDFWETHAVIVLPDETYHRYDCSRVSDVDSPVICNWELAKSLGFTPCSDCKPTYLTIRERLDRMMSE